MKRLLALVLLATSAAHAEPPALIESRKIWDAAPHNAFTDLARWRDAWWCVFRESDGHVGGDGKIRVLTSSNHSVVPAFHKCGSKIPIP